MCVCVSVSRGPVSPLQAGEGAAARPGAVRGGEAGPKAETAATAELRSFLNFYPPVLSLASTSVARWGLS